MDTNEEILSLALIEVINTVKAGKEFVIEHIPEILQQLLVFKLIENCVIMTIIVAVIILGYLLTFKWVDQEKDWAGDWELAKMISFPFFSLITFFGSIQFMCSLITVVKILVAPKLYILEYAVNFVK